LFFQSDRSDCAGRANRARGADWSAAVELRGRVRAEIVKRCAEPDLA
jgi:hypothetical protein